MPPAMLTILLLSLSPVLAGSEGPGDGLISSLQAATSYLARAFEDFNLDGLVGYRFLKDWCKKLLKEWEMEPDKQSQYQQLAKIVEDVSPLIERAMDVLSQTDQEYVRDFGTIMKDDFWKPPGCWAETDPSLSYDSINRTECLPLEMSNLCIMTILGHGEENETTCYVPPMCRRIMTKSGCIGYSLSHQLFYSMIAIQNGCQDKLFQVESQRNRNVFCANMMIINQKIEEENYPFDQQDLFLENIMFCGMCGFSDFLKPTWLKTILSWQDPETGCFGKSISHSAGLWNPEIDSVSKIKDALPGEGTVHNDQENHIHRRVKRREKRLTDGCLCHMTSVAVGALAPFLSVC
ncbi:UPF0764 protein C16orf89 homolog [Ambystoma mexicanum]|uniref:UPF0764 protein C16orf89 homolog n=1 Tax=Ambystoma mexicanum TaxID=8296 RepID=UPI0037E92B02